MYNRKIEVNPSGSSRRSSTIRGSFAYDDEFPMVIDAIERGDIDPALFISHEFGLDEYRAGVPHAARPRRLAEGDGQPVAAALSSAFCAARSALMRCVASSREASDTDRAAAPSRSRAAATRSAW